LAFSESETLKFRIPNSDIIDLNRLPIFIWISFIERIPVAGPPGDGGPEKPVSAKFVLSAVAENASQFTSA